MSVLIKGINKQILEVTNTGSPYFEKIIFFVRPEGQKLSENELKTEAEKISISAKTQRPPKSRKTLRQKLSSAGFIFLGIGAGAAISVIINYAV